MVNGGDTGTLVASPNPVNFGATSIGQTASTTVSLLNGSSAPVEINQLSLTGQSFSVASPSTLPITIGAGGTYNLNVQFNPVAAGAATGQLNIASNSSTNAATAITLNGTGTVGTTTAALSALSCNNESLTGSGTDACTVTLNAAAPSGGLSVSLSSTNAAVTVPASVMVPANASNAGFTATVASVGTAQAVTLQANADNVSENFSLQLNAAVPTLSINATSVGFGDVEVNTSVTQSVTLTSTGTAPVTASAATLTGTGFTLSGATFPVTLNPSQAFTLYVLFDPGAAGAATGQLTITSNSSTNGTAVIGLNGTGTAPEVDLSWDAPSSSADPIAGYNVYRTLSGSSTYELLNSSVDTETAYVDNTVQCGLTYDYIVESVDDSEAESVPSNMISMTIP